MTLESALNHLFRQVPLAWTIKDEALLITTKTGRCGGLVARVFPVTGLVRAHETGRCEKCCDEQVITEQALVHMITRVIAPQSWAEAGGCGVIDYYPLGQAVVVTQTPDILEQVAELLATLRHVQGAGVCENAAPSVCARAPARPCCSPSCPSAECINVQQSVIKTSCGEFKFAVAQPARAVTAPRPSEPAQAAKGCCCQAAPAAPACCQGSCAYCPAATPAPAGNNSLWCRIFFPTPVPEPRGFMPPVATYVVAPAPVPGLALPCPVPAALTFATPPRPATPFHPVALIHASPSTSCPLTMQHCAEGIRIAGLWCAEEAICDKVSFDCPEGCMHLEGNIRLKGMNQADTVVLKGGHVLIDWKNHQIRICATQGAFRAECRHEFDLPVPPPVPAPQPTPERVHGGIE
jgi:hypothetical protein